MSETAQLSPAPNAWRPWANAAAVVTSAVAVGWATGWVAIHVAGAEHPKWLLARVSGVAALLMITALVVLGLLLAHPRGTVLRSLPRATLLRIHVGLAAFAAVFTALHVVVLALDEYAGVGWAGVLLPLGAEYRPLPVTLGWLALYAGLAAGLTARFAGQLGRIWFPLHRVTIVTYAVVWGHGIWTGSDTGVLLPLYAGSALLVITAAVSRYVVAPVRTSLGEARP